MNREVEQLLRAEKDSDMEVIEDKEDAPAPSEQTPSSPSESSFEENRLAITEATTEAPKVQTEEKKEPIVEEPSPTVERVEEKAPEPQSPPESPSESVQTEPTSEPQTSKDEPKPQEPPKEIPQESQSTTSETPQPEQVSSYQNEVLICEENGNIGK